MSDLISKLSDLRSQYNCFDEHERDAYGTLSEAIKVLSEQTEIVRCKDCRHSEPWYGDKRRCFLWAEDGIDVFEDGFCNYAKRRKQDE